MSLLNTMSLKELKDCIRILKDSVTQHVFKYGYYDERTQQTSKRLELYKRHYENIEGSNN